ncbi:hypothetical protein EIP91_010438 [Steccherinum ochraceum]|uniref:Uncharacterized protein n=1 Tax=Steccherinum ochraceum TaxID=92696 RepID=A0A4R0RCS6_9APHY|nr:hypothetical protein EIP91_010438 [Steccherinum ochraceum]
MNASTRNAPKTQKSQGHRKSSSKKRTRKNLSSEELESRRARWRVKAREYRAKKKIELNGGVPVDPTFIVMDTGSFEEWQRRKAAAPARRIQFRSTATSTLTRTLPSLPHDAGSAGPQTEEQDEPAPVHRQIRRGTSVESMYTNPPSPSPEEPLIHEASGSSVPLDQPQKAPTPPTRSSEAHTAEENMIVKTPTLPHSRSSSHSHRRTRTSGSSSTRSTSAHVPARKLQEATIVPPPCLLTSPSVVHRAVFPKSFVPDLPASSPAVDDEEPQAGPSRLPTSFDTLDDEEEEVERQLDPGNEEMDNTKARCLQYMPKSDPERSNAPNSQIRRTPTPNPTLRQPNYDPDSPYDPMQADTEEDRKPMTPVSPVSLRGANAAARWEAVKKCTRELEVLEGLLREKDRTAATVMSERAKAEIQHFDLTSHVASELRAAQRLSSSTTFARIGVKYATPMSAQLVIADTASSTHSLDIWLSIIDCIADIAAQDVMNTSTRFSLLYACNLVCVSWHSRASWHLKILRYVPHTLLRSFSDYKHTMEFFLKNPERGEQVDVLEIRPIDSGNIFDIDGDSSQDSEDPYWIASVGKLLGPFLPRLRILVLRRVRLMLFTLAINFFESYTIFRPLETLYLHQPQFHRNQLRNLAGMLRPMRMLVNDDASPSAIPFPITPRPVLPASFPRPFYTGIQEVVISTSWSKLAQIELFNASNIYELSTLSSLKLSVRAGDDEEGPGGFDRHPVDVKIWAGITLLFRQTTRPNRTPLTMVIDLYDALTLKIWNENDPSTGPYACLSIDFRPTSLFSRVSAVAGLISSLQPRISFSLYLEHFVTELQYLQVLLPDLPELRFRKAVVTVSPGADATRNSKLEDPSVVEAETTGDALKAHWSDVDEMLAVLGAWCDKDVVFASDWNREGPGCRCELARTVFPKSLEGKVGCKCGFGEKLLLPPL